MGGYVCVLLYFSSFENEDADGSHTSVNYCSLVAPTLRVIIPENERKNKYVPCFYLLLLLIQFSFADVHLPSSDIWTGDIAIDRSGSTHPISGLVPTTPLRLPSTCHAYFGTFLVAGFRGDIQRGYREVGSFTIFYPTVFARTDSRSCALHRYWLGSTPASAFPLPMQFRQCPSQCR